MTTVQHGFDFYYFGGYYKYLSTGAMMRKLMACCLISTVLCACVSGPRFSVEGDRISPDGFAYNVNDDDSVTITGYSESTTDIVIPALIDGRQVTAIGPEAFKGKSYGIYTGADSYTRITSLVLPDGLVSIGNEAFAACMVRNLEIPESVTFIGDKAFGVIGGTLTISADIRHIGAKAFLVDNKWALPSIVIKGDGLKLEKAQGFSSDFVKCYEENGWSAGVYVPVRPSSFGRLFSNHREWKKLGDYVIPDGIAHGFVYTVNDDDSVTITGYKDSATDVVIPAMIDGRQVTAIGPRALYVRITSLVLPEGIKVIGDEAFVLCNVQDLEIPESVTFIGDNAFRTISDTLIIPAGIQHIGAKAFSGHGKRIIVKGDGLELNGSQGFSRLFLKCYAEQGRSAGEYAFVEPSFLQSLGSHREWEKL